MVADGQTGLAAADDDGLDLLDHASGEPAQHSVVRGAPPGPLRAAAAGSYWHRGANAGTVPSTRHRPVLSRQQPRLRRQEIPEVRPWKHGMELKSHSVSGRAGPAHWPTASGAREARIGLMRENLRPQIGDWVLDPQVSRSGVRSVPVPPHECPSSRAPGALATHSARAIR